MVNEEEDDRADVAHVRTSGLDEVDDDSTHEMDRDVLPTGELPALIRDDTAPRRRIRPVRLTIKALLLVILAVFLLPPVLSGFRDAWATISDVNSALLALGFGLQLLSLVAYALLTRATLGSAGRRLSISRIFPICRLDSSAMDARDILK